MADIPSWLTRVENGGIGEARTKAFLIDRFWILERSVDIQGADFIIQRRLTSQNLLDESPPRLGVVQVKFIQDERTTQYIHREYIYDHVGQPRKEFFLMVHSGLHDQKRQFLLSAEDIVNNFRVVSEGHAKENNFAIPGRVILSSSRFEVLSSERALNKIESSLRLADFVKNRRFMSWVLPSYSDFTPQDIEDKYLVELDNWWGDIPQNFYELKKRIEVIFENFMEVTEPLNRVIRETDPSKALDILEDFYREFMKYGNGRGDVIQFQADIYDSDFHSVVIEHREKYKKLTECGYLDKFLIIQREFINFVCFDLAPKMKLDSNLAYVVDVRYNQVGLDKFTFNSCIVPQDNLPKLVEDNQDDIMSERLKGVLKSEPGYIQVFFIPGRFGYKDQGDSESQGTDYWKQKIKEVVWVIQYPLMEEIYNNIFDIEVLRFNS